MKLLYSLIILLLMWTGIHAQGERNSSLTAKGHYGFLIAHRPIMQHLIKGHASAFELDYQIRTGNQKNWHQLYGYPSWGFTLYAANPGNPDLLGKGYALNSYVDFKLLEKNNFRLNFKMAAGLGIITKPFDRFDNYKNIAIGSYLNGTMNVQLEFEQILSKRLLLQGGFSFFHFSNASAKVPNLGYNIPTVNLGLGYQFRPLDSFYPEEMQDAETAFAKNWIFDTQFSLGIKETYPVEGKLYGIYSLFLNSQRKLSRKSTFLAGVDLIYNSALLEEMKTAGVEAPNDWVALRPGVNAGYGLSLEQLLLHIQFGAYLYNYFPAEDGWLYHRVGARYYFDNNLVLSASLKTHYAVADYFEFGIGYRFP